MATGISEPSRKSPKRSASSSLKLHDVEVMYETKLVWKVCDIVSDCPAVTVTNEYVGKVVEYWTFLKKKFSEFPGLSEPIRKDYLAGMLAYLPDFDEMQLVKECLVRSVKLDYAFVAYNYLSTPLVCIFEAKNSDLDDNGRAHIYVQLKTCYDVLTSDCRALIEKFYTNQDGKKDDDSIEKKYLELVKKFPLYVYGIVTTMNLWLFVRFDGKSCMHSKKMLIEDEEDQEGIKKVSTNMIRILSRQQAFLEELLPNLRAHHLQFTTIPSTCGKEQIQSGCSSSTDFSACCEDVILCHGQVAEQASPRKRRKSQRHGGSWCTDSQSDEDMACQQIQLLHQVALQTLKVQPND
jgi:hypothetical protein